MAEILNFEAYRDPKDMTREELTALLEQLRAEIAELDAAEPEDMESEECVDPKRSRVEHT